MYATDDTIAAIASAPGGAARGIVRLSGPGVLAIVERCFRPDEPQSLSSIRTATALTGSVSLASPHLPALAADLYLWPDQRSYTRQSVAEFHVVGSPPLIAVLLKTLCEAGARLAEPGEFTLRAFLAGRLDLTQAEAVLGVIDARSRRELDTALVQLAGGLATPLHELRDQLLDLLAQLEAGLDFVEEDIQFITPAQIQASLESAQEVICRLTAQIAARTRSDDFPRVALLGYPNVGKSSLFNALTRDGSALVSSEPGTTRDYLVAQLDMNGIGCQLIDTAGAEPHLQVDSIAESAQQLAAGQVENCDVRLLCLDATRALNAWEDQQLHAPDSHQILVLTKCDGLHVADVGSDAIETSVLADWDIEGLRQAIRAAVIRLEPNEAAVGLTGERCGVSLRRAAESLARAVELNASRAGEELIAAELRLVLVELGQIVGAVYTDDILDRIFSRFCIGK